MNETKLQFQILFCKIDLCPTLRLRDEGQPDFIANSESLNVIVRQYLPDWCENMKPEYMMASAPHDFVLSEDTLSGLEQK